MKTLNEITNIIAKQLGDIAHGTPEIDAVAPDCEIVVCPERIFVDDYLQQRADAYMNMNSDQLPSLNGEEPNFVQFQNTIFFVIKVGGGQRNMAVSNTSISIQALSEENEFLAAMEIMRKFVYQYNFQYKDGIAQAYFEPEFVNSQESVYTGFRALISLRGTVRVPEDGFPFVLKLDADFSYGGEDYSFSIPFLSIGYSINAQPDPQAFAGNGGFTKAINRQATETFSISTYLPFYGDGNHEASDAFTKSILGADKKLNTTFRLSAKTPNPDFLFTEGDFLLTGMTYSQEIADLAPFSLTFTSADKMED